MTQWVQARMPRVSGLPHTAPVYDAVTSPVTAPVLAACVRSATKGCRCYTQQGTRMEVDPDLCARIVERGYFVDWGQDVGRGAAEPTRAPRPESIADDRRDPVIADAGRWAGIPPLR